MSFADHDPVMESEIVEALSPRDGGVYVDATFGGGGYTRAILKVANCTVYGFDRDPTAIDAAQSWIDDYDGKIILINRPFAEMKDALDELGVGSVDGIVFDIGVSSMHLDNPERGFSFMREGPLSMRMDGGKPDARDVIALASPRDMARIFKAFGEEKKSRLLANAIVRAREVEPIKTTTQLAAIIEKAAPQRGAKIHPATRAFQALRIFVNDELGQLINGLRAAERLLKPGGILVVVTFHSLEDRIVKRFLSSRIERPAGGSRHAPPVELQPVSFALITAKAVLPTNAEIERNPRARSAKMRAGVRLEGPAAPANDDEELGAPGTVSWDILLKGVV